MKTFTNTQMKLTITMAMIQNYNFNLKIIYSLSSNSIGLVVKSSNLVLTNLTIILSTKNNSINDSERKIGTFKSTHTKLITIVMMQNYNFSPDN